MLEMKSTGLVVFGAVGNLAHGDGQLPTSVGSPVQMGWLHSSSAGSERPSGPWRSACHTQTIPWGTWGEHRAPGGVLKHHERDGVSQVLHPLSHIVIHNSSLRIKEEIKLFQFMFMFMNTMVLKRFLCKFERLKRTWMATSKTTLKAFSENWYIGFILLRSLRMK